MLGKLHTLIIDCSLSWWKTGLLILLFGMTMSQLFVVTNEFPGLATSNNPGETLVPFDMQNDLTTSQLYEQLAFWSPQAFARYRWFQIVDFVFPLVGGLMSAALAALGLRLLSEKYYGIAVSRKLFLLFLIATCFDWLENLGFIWILTMWPDQSMAAAQLAILAKQGKLLCLTIFQPIWIMLLVCGVSVWTYRKAIPER